VLLENKTHDLRAARLVQGRQIAAVEEHPARPQGQQPGNAAQQCRLAAAIRPQQAEDLPLAEFQVQPIKDGPGTIAEGGSLQRDASGHQAQPPRVRRSITAKKGAPTMAVRIPSGISAAIVERARSSMTTR
jgi:hypothetical protein